MLRLRLLYEYWCKISDKIRFLIIGAINCAISYVIFVLAVIILGEGHADLCVTLQWVISSVISYLNQKFFVFCTKGNYLKEYFRCCMTWAVSYVFNIVILKLMMKYVIANVYVAQFVSLFLVSVITYVLFKYFAFKVKRKNN